MTGRAAGYCAGYAVPGYMNPVAGRGRGCGRGRGFGGGWGRSGLPRYGGDAQAAAQYPMAPTREQQIEMLKSQSEGLESALSDIRQRISELNQ